MAGKSSLESKYEVNPNGCWEWKFPLSNGYGLLRISGKKQVGAHRFFYEKFKGKIPQGKHIDHLCRNAKCVNPDHLEVVSVRQNVRRGNLTKLSVESVGRMRHKRVSGSKLSELSLEFGISMGHISEICRGKYWDDAEGAIAPRYLRNG
jgi:hypothetical protein